MANVFVGQFFTREPDLEWFRSRAAQFGFDSGDYLAAVRDVPVIAEERIPAILDLLMKMTRVVTSLSVDRQRAIDDQARQKVILDTIPQFVFWKDLDGRYLGCNAALARLAGLNSSEEIVGKTDFELPWRSQAESFRAVDQEVTFTRQARLHIVETVHQQDGSELVLDTSKIPLIHSGAVLRGTVGIAQDITASRRAADELQASEARFRTLIENAPLAVGLSRGCRTLYANAKYRELFRIPPTADVVGQSILHYWAPDSAAKIQDYADRRARGEPVPNSYEGIAIRADGESFPAHVAVTTVQLPDGPAGVGFFVDLTEIRRAHEAARRADEQYRSIVENAQEGIITFDRNWHIAFTNARCDAIMGYERGELIGRPIVDIILDADRGAHLQRRARWEAGAQGVYEACYRRKDGTGVWLQVSGWTAFESGAFAGFNTMVTDITARRQADELRTRMAAIVESSEDAIISKTLEGVVTSWNRGAEKLFGFTAAEAIGKPMLTIFPPDRAEEEASILARIARGETVDNYETTRVTKSGKVIAVSATISPLRDASGRIVGASKIARDITAAKQAEQSLREAEGLYRGIFEGAAEGIFRTSPEGIPLTANPAMARMLGYDSPDQLITSVGDTQSVFWQNPSEREAFMRRIETDVEVRNFECQLRRRDGALIWALTSARRVAGPDGRTIYIEGFISDITEKKKMEEQFLRVQRLESIGMLAAGIAHDLNNVLAPIGMAVPLLRNSRSEPGDLRLLRTLETSAQRGSSLVRQILGFAHGISGAPQLVQVKHLLRDIMEMIVETFPKSIVLDESIPRDLWPVLANPTQLHQVLLNLSVNARDAMPQGGRLRLTAENQSLTGEQAALINGARPGAWVALHVQDSGTGIRPEILPHIWEPFFTTKGTGRGTGLGLPTVRGIVETHGGFVSVETELGRGTTFRVYLPAAESPTNQAVNDGPPLPAPGHGETILFADDETAIRDIAELTLSRAGYKVTLAVNGAEATRLFHSQPDTFALIVTDIDMPERDGATFAHKVRALRPAMKILVMSGTDMRTSELKWQEFADEFLQKPFMPEKFLAAVQRLLPAAGNTGAET